MTTSMECTINCQAPEERKESISLRERIVKRIMAFRIHGAESMSKIK